MRNWLTASAAAVAISLSPSVGSAAIMKALIAGTPEVIAAEPLLVEQAIQAIQESLNASKLNHLVIQASSPLPFSTECIPNVTDAKLTALCVTVEAGSRRDETYADVILFFTNTQLTGTTGLGTIPACGSIDENWMSVSGYNPGVSGTPHAVAINFDCFEANPSALAHEFGHLLYLEHSDITNDEFPSEPVTFNHGWATSNTNAACRTIMSNGLPIGPWYSDPEEDFTGFFFHGKRGDVHEANAVDYINDTTWNIVCNYRVEPPEKAEFENFEFLFCHRQGCGTYYVEYSAERATTFRLQRSIGVPGVWTNYAVTEDDEIFVEGGSPRIYWRVRGENAGGEGDWSNTLSTPVDCPNNGGGGGGGLHDLLLGNDQNYLPVNRSELRVVRRTE